MSSRIWNALGALAVVAVVFVFLALAFAIVESGGEAAPASAPPYAVEVSGGQGGAGEGGGERRTATASASPVPAMSRKPARGPAFAIVRVREGKRAALRRAPGGELVRWLGAPTEFGSRETLSVVAQRPGWLGVASPDLPNHRLGWVRRDPRQVDVYWTKYSLNIDVSARRLALRYGPAAVASFPVTVGAAGTGTPTGRYGVTDALSFDESPSYGCCALALSASQTDLPPDWIGGDRVAIHGTPGPVGGAESHGCIRATNAAMRLLFERIPLGTPVFVTL